MDIKIYTNSGCVWCARTKELMARANLEYTETLWDSMSPIEQRELQNKLSLIHISEPTRR